MIHARKDYDRIQDPDCKIPIDEPVFLIRGQDPVGSEVVRYWFKRSAELARTRGGLENLSDLATAIDVHATKMANWAANVRHGVATVDSDQLRLF